MTTTDNTILYPDSDVSFEKLYLCVSLSYFVCNASAIHDEKEAAFLEEAALPAQEMSVI